eukprot:5536199-Amphidinium_carterae.3
MAEGVAGSIGWLVSRRHSTGCVLHCTKDLLLPEVFAHPAISEKVATAAVGTRFGSTQYRAPDFLLLTTKAFVDLVFENIGQSVMAP